MLKGSYDPSFCENPELFQTTKVGNDAQRKGGRRAKAKGRADSFAGSKGRQSSNRKWEEGGVKTTQDLKDKS